MTRQKYLQLIHIAVNNLKLDDTTYRQMLQRLTGKTSAKALNIGQLAQVLNALKTKGFRIQPHHANTKKQTDRPRKSKNTGPVAGNGPTRALSGMRQQ